MAVMMMMMIMKVSPNEPVSFILRHQRTGTSWCHWFSSSLSAVWELLGITRQIRKMCSSTKKKKNKNPWHEFLPKGKWNKYGLEDQWHHNVMIPTGPACLTLRETFKINTWFYISWSWISHLTLKSADGNSELPFHRKLRFFIPTLRGENFFCRVYFPLTFCWLLPNIPIFILWKSACKSVKCYWRIQFI